ncbi:hypothetical protein FN3523_0710 [Francisella hispaniensis]|uniref:Uncharacterized protein n=2 Tax=Francisella hispaniensis TaxID=622488 RepID=F4BK73_9GAMM|nr:hypothetical protein FN3523_0710 [Francisella hispaniensis]
MLTHNSQMIDSLSVKAHVCASGYVVNGNQINALGKSARSLITKIYNLTDALGNPVRFYSKYSKCS